MPLYEVVLRYPDRDEVRLTDQVLRAGETVSVAGDLWRVTTNGRPRDKRASAGFVCEPALDARERERRAQAWIKELLSHTSKLNGKAEGLDRADLPRKTRAASND
jgi:hypothetical protein